jgi:hypothetical protein
MATITTYSGLRKMLLANSGGEPPGALGYFPVGATHGHADQ